MRQDRLNERVQALGQRARSPGRGEELRAAVVRELEDWRSGLVIAPCNLLLAVERYDELDRPVAGDPSDHRHDAIERRGELEDEVAMQRLDERP